MYLYKINNNQLIYVYASCSGKKIPVIDMGNCSSIIGAAVLSFPALQFQNRAYVEHIEQRTARISCGNRRGQLLCLIVIMPGMEVSSLIATCVPACDT